MNRALMKTIVKILVFVALIVIYFLFARAPGWQTLFGQKLAGIYALGAVLALWVGGERIGTLEPITLRPIFIALGVILMIAMFILRLTTRDFARRPQEGVSNKPAAPNAEIALRFYSERPWPGVGEPGR